MAAVVKINGGDSIESATISSAIRFAARPTVLQAKRITVPVSDVHSAIEFPPQILAEKPWSIASIGPIPCRAPTRLQIMYKLELHRQQSFYFVLAVAGNRSTATATIGLE
jgi:hypothetical protein